MGDMLRRLEELRAMTDDELVATANSFLDPEDKNQYVGLGLSLGQFYMGEIERRERRREEDWRDRIETIRHRVNLAIELFIVLLIGLELGLAWKEGTHQEEAARLQQKVLQNLADSSSATANTLKDVETTMQIMSGNVEKQLGLNYELAPTVSFDPTSHFITISNNGPTAITVAGWTIGKYAEKLRAPENVLTHTSNRFYFEWTELKLHGEVRDNAKEMTLMIFCKAENGEEYTINVEVIIRQPNSGGYDLRIGKQGVSPHRWGNWYAGKEMPY
jgi:hypothetical protein